MPRPGYLLLIATALLLIGLGRPATAFAHPIAVRTEPPSLCPPLRADDPRCQSGPILAGSPTVVRVWFSEAVEPVRGGITVRGPNGQRVDRGPAQVASHRLTVPIQATDPGTYLVEWQVVGDDTHPARGSFVFSVGQSSPVPVPGGADLGAVAPIGLAFQTAARWLHAIGYALAFGVLVFGALAQRRLAPSSVAIAELRLRRLISAGIVVLLLAEPLALLGQTGSFGAEALLDPSTVSDTFDSSFGRVFAQRLAAPVLLWLFLGLGIGRRSPALSLALIVGGGLAVLEGAASHASLVGLRWPGLVLAAVHQAAAGVWVGTLLALVAVGWVPVLRSERGTLVALAGRISLVAVGTIVVTGLGLAGDVLIVGAPNAASLLAAPYTWTLLAKIGVVALALLSAAATTRGRQLASRRLELAAVLVVLGLAGLLVSLPPPV